MTYYNSFVHVRTRSEVLHTRKQLATHDIGEYIGYNVTNSYVVLVAMMMV